MQAQLLLCVHYSPAITPSSLQQVFFWFHFLEAMMSRQTQLLAPSVFRLLGHSRHTPNRCVIRWPWCGPVTQFNPACVYDSNLNCTSLQTVPGYVQMFHKANALYVAKPKNTKRKLVSQLDWNCLTLPSNCKDLNINHYIRPYG